MQTVLRAKTHIYAHTQTHMQSLCENTHACQQTHNFRVQTHAHAHRRKDYFNCIPSSNFGWRFFDMPWQIWIKKEVVLTFKKHLSVSVSLPPTHIFPMWPRRVQIINGVLNNDSDYRQSENFAVIKRLTWERQKRQKERQSKKRSTIIKANHTIDSQQGHTHLDLESLLPADLNTASSWCVILVACVYVFEGTWPLPENTKTIGRKEPILHNINNDNNKKILNYHKSI